MEREFNKNGNITMPTPLAQFLESERDRLGWTWTKLQEVTGESDSNIARLRSGQEARPSQLAKFAKAFDRPFWYVVQKAGYTIENPNEPGAEARRLGVVFSDDQEMKELFAITDQLNGASRQAVLRMARSLLDSQGSSPMPQRKR
jgi:transcriptional regulator with XRE-family HTH domain